MAKAGSVFSTGRTSGKLASGELGVLRGIRARAGRANGRVRLGIGDDCALLRLKSGDELAVTTDLSIEGRHFRLDWHTPESVGHRTLARGLSDLAAMGAEPVAAFLSLGLPARLAGTRSGRADEGVESRSWLDRFLDGLLGLAEANGVTLAGGDLAESPVAVADIVLTGAVARGKALLRSGARVGDGIYVTGVLGAAAAELAALSAHPRRFARVRNSGSGEFAHLFPVPRVAQGLRLRRAGLATAAIDISDGLSTELEHLCDESGVAAEIEALRIPIGAGATLEQALHGGEDYELLFTAGARVPRRIAGVAVTRIGQVVAARHGQAAVTLIAEGGREPLIARGWEHFR